MDINVYTLAVRIRRTTFLKSKIPWTDFSSLLFYATTNCSWNVFLCFLLIHLCFHQWVRSTSWHHKLAEKNIMIFWSKANETFLLNFDLLSCLNALIFASSQIKRWIVNFTKVLYLLYYVCGMRYGNAITTWSYLLNICKEKILLHVGRMEIKKTDENEIQNK